MKVKVRSKSCRFRENLNDLIDSFDDKVVEKPVRFHTEGLLENIKRRSPVDTGELRNSFKTSYEWNNGTFSSYITSDCFYLKFVTEGTGIYNPDGRKTPWVYFKPDPNGKPRYDGQGNFIGTGFFYTTRGIKPNSFIQEAIFDEKANLRLSIRIAIRQYLKGK